MKKIALFLLMTALGFSILTGCIKKGENENPSSVLQEEEDFISEEGVYVGEIDSNSIEVIVEGEAKAFRIEELQENDKVKIKYIENEHGQLIVKEIEKK